MSGREVKAEPVVDLVQDKDKMQVGYLYKTQNKLLNYLFCFQCQVY